MTSNELAQWHEICADNASRRGSHTIAKKHAQTAHILRTIPLIQAPDDYAPANPAIIKQASPDVAQAARVLLDHYDNLDCVEAVSRDFIDTLHGAIMLHGAIAGETP